MQSGLQPGDICLTTAVTPDTVKHGDVVIIKLEEEKNNYIKRIIGLPGEMVQIKDGILYVDNKLVEEDYLDKNNIKIEYFEYHLGQNEYLVLGDNRKASTDSRTFGAVAYKEIKRKVLIKLPF